MKRELLVWAKHTKRWEFAHKELIDLNGITVQKKSDSDDARAMWVRDDRSTICLVGDELATMPVPPSPAKGQRTNGLAANCIAITAAFHQQENFDPIDTGKMAFIDRVEELAQALTEWESKHSYEKPGGKDWGEVCEVIAELAVSRPNERADRVVKVALSKCGNY